MENDHSKIVHLRSILHGQSVLYVEDSRSMNALVSNFFYKIFDNVIVAFDGHEGLQLFLEHRPKIVITDIEMPKMDGMSMAKEILSVESETKIIIMTAHFKNDLLHESIRLHVFDYLVKPIKTSQVMNVFNRLAEVLSKEVHETIYNTYLNKIFNYQHNLIVFLHHDEIVLVNQRCLDFFDASSIEIFKNKFSNFGDILLEHSGFLYNHDEIVWFNEIKNDPDRLFNVKIADSSGNSHHFVLNYQLIPEQEGFGILSLNDVTELNLLKLFDPKAVEAESLQKDKKAIMGLLEMAKRNSAKIKMYSFYKGLSISNDGVIDYFDDKQISVKTVPMQLKAIQFEKSLVLVSDIFPMFIKLSNLVKIDYDKQSVSFNTYRMSETSPTRREFIRVSPDDRAKITLLYQGHKFDTDITIGDISVKAIRLILASLPSGFQVKSKATVDLVLGDIRPFIINTEAEVLRIQEQPQHYEVVLMYDLHNQIYKNLSDYIAKRQLDLIREFKKMQLDE